MNMSRPNFRGGSCYAQRGFEWIIQPEVQLSVQINMITSRKSSHWNLYARRIPYATEVISSTEAESGTDKQQYRFTIFVLLTAAYGWLTVPGSCRSRAEFGRGNASKLQSVILTSWSVQCALSSAARGMAAGPRDNPQE